MKTFKSLLTETEQITDMEELESSADLFQYGLEKGYYTLLQTKEYNNTYWRIKNNIITKAIKDKFQNINSLDLTYIVTNAPVGIKENENELISYVRDVLKRLKKSRVVA